MRQNLRKSYTVVFLEIWSIRMNKKQVPTGTPLHIPLVSYGYCTDLLPLIPLWWRLSVRTERAVAQDTRVIVTP